MRRTRPSVDKPATGAYCATVRKSCGGKSPRSLRAARFRKRFAITTRPRGAGRCATRRGQLYRVVIVPIHQSHFPIAAELATYGHSASETCRLLIFLLAIAPLQSYGTSRLRRWAKVARSQGEGGRTWRTRDGRSYRQNSQPAVHAATSQLIVRQASARSAERRCSRRRHRADSPTARRVRTVITATSAGTPSSARSASAS